MQHKTYNFCWWVNHRVSQDCIAFVSVEYHVTQHLQYRSSQRWSLQLQVTILLISPSPPQSQVSWVRVDSFKPCDWSVGNDYLLPLADIGDSHFSTRYSTITHVVSASKRSRLYFKHYYEYGTTKIRVRQTNYMQHHNW